MKDDSWVICRSCALKKGARPYCYKPPRNYWLATCKYCDEIRLCILTHECPTYRKFTIWRKIKNRMISIFGKKGWDDSFLNSRDPINQMYKDK